MSTPSSKTIVTTDRPAFDIDRTGRARQAAHHDLDGISDEPLDFGGRHARGGGQDFDLDIGHVREGVDRDAQDGPGAQGDEEENADEDENPLAERALNETLNHAHVRPPSPPCASRISGGSLRR